MSAAKSHQNKAELVKADTALRSFRDGGYTLADAIGEIVDNSKEAGASEIRLDWTEEDVKVGKNKTHRELTALALADNGAGIPENILAHTLTVGFSTRYGSRAGIGRFGVGFKLGALSQARRLEIYTCPTYLSSTQEKGEDGSPRWVSSDRNTEGRIFMSYFDLDEIEAGNQSFYDTKEVEAFPEEFAGLMKNYKSGTLIVLRKPDRINLEQAYSDRLEDKLNQLHFFLARAYRVFIDGGLKIFTRRTANKPLPPHDPTFQLENPIATELLGADIRGEEVEKGSFMVDEHEVSWIVTLCPKEARPESGSGGEVDAQGKSLKQLRIPDNEGKLSFLRHSREISYTTVPKMLPDGVQALDRYIGIEIRFPPALDEYFQVRHIKRGVEPVEKLRERLKQEIKKPVQTARNRVRKHWADNTKANAQATGTDVSGGRGDVEALVKGANSAMPTGRAGENVTPSKEETELRSAAESAGITDKKEQDKFVERARQNPIVSLDKEWPGKGLVDIEHLNRTVLVQINRRHPFIQEVYLPLKAALEKGAESLDPHAAMELLRRATKGFDLLLFAYAKAENMNPDPEKEFSELREDWGKFAALFLRRLDEVTVKERDE
jgi:hypothetical protein